MATLRNAVVVNDTRVDLHHGCNSVMSSIGQLLFKNGFKVSMFWPAHANWQNSKAFHDALSNAEILVVNGEGTIHHDAYSGDLLLRLGEEAARRGIPAVLINTGWESNSSDFIRKLSFFDIVAARDTHSANLMSASGNEVRVVPDLSFWFSQNFGPGFTNGEMIERCGIGVTDNVHVSKSLQLAKLRRKLNGEAICINYGYEGLYGWLHFVRDALSLRRDFMSPNKLLSVIIHRHQLWSRRYRNEGDFIAALSKLQLLVSGRFHACTLAISTGTPVIAQSSNTHKITSLFHDVGLDVWRLDYPFDGLEFMDENEYAWSAGELRNIERYVERAELEAENLFSDISDLVS